MHTAEPHLVLSHVDSQRTITGKQSQILTPTLFSRTAPVEKISAGYVHMPGGTVSKPHTHEDNAIIVAVIDGDATTHAGDDMHPYPHGPAEAIYVPPGVPHAAHNRRDDHVVAALEVRTDPHFDEDTHVRGDLTELLHDTPATPQTESDGSAAPAVVRLDHPVEETGRWSSVLASETQDVAVSMTKLVLEPNQSTQAGVSDCEQILCVMSGMVTTVAESGESVTYGPRSMLYIRPNTTVLHTNPSGDAPATVYRFRTDAAFCQEHQLIGDDEFAHDELIVQARKEFAEWARDNAVPTW